MPVIVQKFGGTSVSTAASREAAISHIAAARDSGYRVVVVVSAMGRSGDAYATDTLLGLVSGGSEAGGRDKRDLDLVMSCGEIISAVVFAARLRQQFGKVAVLTGWQAGIITDDRYGDARVITVQPERMQQLLNDGHIVVVTGFQGMNQHGEITTLGRGGSDTTAAVLGVALGAKLVEIYTDVPGIMTADPRLVPEARVLPVMDYLEALQLAYEGAKVLHPRAVELAMQQGVQLVVRQTGSSQPGTKIDSIVLYEGRCRQPVVGVAGRSNIAQVVARTESVSPDLDARIFSCLAERGIGLELVNISRERKLFAVAESDLPAVEEALSGLPLTIDLLPGCARVSVIGIGIRGEVGVMARVTQALAGAGVEILQTGDSPLTIACLVAQTGLSKAVNALHREFGLEQSASSTTDAQIGQRKRKED